MSVPYIAISGVADVISATVTTSHASPVSSCSFQCVEHSLQLGDYVGVDIGYSEAHDIIFRGYVKQITREIPDNTYTIELQDKMVRAVDFFIVADSPANPYKFSNIKAEDLVGELLAMAGLTDYDGQNTYFTFGVQDPTEVNLVSTFDYCNTIAQVLTYSLWYDSLADTVLFRNRKPYPMHGDTGQPGDVADTPLPITISIANDLLDYSLSRSEKDLRNKIVVYGMHELAATRSTPSPYLPTGFYKTGVLAATSLLDTQEAVDNTAEYNLNLLNRLTYTIGCTVPGNTDILARRTLTVDIPSLGESNAQWYIYSVNHAISVGGFVTELELRR